MRIGDVPVDFTVESDQRMTVAAPALAVQGALWLRAAESTVRSAQLVRVQLPAVDPYPSDAVVAGETLTLTGRGLDRVTQVILDRVEARFAAQADGSLRVTVPAAARAGELRLDGPER